MANFLTTTGNSYNIEQIIVNSKKELTLVTPFLKLSKNYIERISDANKRNIKITLIYGKSELAEKEKKILSKLDNLEILFFKSLHAKCYFNEESMIITSMNLYEYSEIKNREMGIFIKRNENNNIYQEALNEVISIKNSSFIKKERIFSYDVVDDEDFEETYMEKLFNLLKIKYPKYQIDFDKNITIKDFPYDNFNLKIGYRIELKGNYKLRKNLRYLKKETEPYSDRLYLTYNDTQINVYPHKNFIPSSDEKGIKEIIENKLNSVNNIYSILFKFYNKLS